MTRMMGALRLVAAIVGARRRCRASPPRPPARRRAFVGPAGRRSGCAAASLKPPSRRPNPSRPVTVATGAARFVDRLFVSGTLVPRDEAQVAARIDGLSIVESRPRTATG